MYVFVGLKKVARMLYLSRHYLNRFHFEAPHGGRPYPTMGNECVFTIVQWDFWKETFFKTSLVNLYICWKMKYIQKVFEYVRDLVLLCWKALIPKKVAWKLVVFIKITVSGIKKTIFYLLGTYNERSFIL